MALHRISLVERCHDVLGMQRHDRRRNLRMRGQCLSDVIDIRDFPMEPQGVERVIAIHFPGYAVDCVGEILSDRGADFLAVAGPRKRICRHRLARPMVRISRHARRFAMDMGMQPGPVRHNGFPLRRQLVQVQCQGEIRSRKFIRHSPACAGNSFNVNVLLL